MVPVHTTDPPLKGGHSALQGSPPPHDNLTKCSLLGGLAAKAASWSLQPFPEELGVARTLWWAGYTGEIN